MALTNNNDAEIVKELIKLNAITREVLKLRTNYLNSLKQLGRKIV